MKSIDKLLSHALSDKELKDFFDGKVNILRYADLKDFDHLDDVLGPYGRCIMLFENENDYNHWVSLVRIEIARRKPYVLFFDSYGCVPENEFDYIPKSFQKLSHQERGVLLKLLINQPLQVHYSQYRLQHLGKLRGTAVNTCGRWAALRCLYNMITEDEFNELFRMGEVFGITTDELCTLVYEEIKDGSKYK